MFKKLPSFLLCLAACYFLASCNNEQTTSTTPPLDPLDSMIAVAKEVQQTVAEDSAIFLYETALEKAKAENKYRQQLYLHDKLGDGHFFMGNARLAMKHLRAAQKLIKDHPEHHEEIGMIYSTLGNYHSKTLHPDSGLYYLEKSLQYRLKHLGPDHEDIGSSYFTLNFYYTYVRNEYNKGIKLGEKALELRKKSYGKESSYVAECYLNLAYANNKLGDNVQAIKYQEQVVDIFEKTLPVDSYGLLLAYSNLGQYLLDQNKHHEAKKYFKKILSAETQTETKYLQIMTQNLLGDCFLKDTPTQAKKIYLQTLDTLSKLFNKKHPSNYLTYLRLSKYQEKMHNYDSAILMLKIADELLKPYRNLRPSSYFTLSETFSKLYLSKGQNKKAIPYIQAMINIALQRFNSFNDKNQQNSLAIRIDFDLFKGYSQYAKALSSFKKTNSLKQSLEYFEAAIQILETLKKDYSTNLSRSQIAGTTTEVYQNAIKVALRLAEITKEQSFIERAFHLAEKNKAFNLLNQVIDAKAKNFAGIPAGVLNTEDSLKRAITFYNNQLYQKSGSNRLDSIQVTSLKRKLFDLELSYENFIQKLKKDYPNYYNIKQRKIEFDIQDFKSRLTKEEALVEFYIGENEVNAFVVTKDDFQHFSTPFTLHPDSLVNTCNSAIKNGNTSEYLDYAHRLYTVLIEPIEETLAEAQISALRIVPHKNLSFLSFDCLITNKEQTDQLSKARYLINDYVTTYHHSASVYLSGGSTSSGNTLKNSQKVLNVFAPVYENSEQLSALPWSVREAESIANAFTNNGWSTHLLMREQATKQSFQNLDNTSKVVHLATHLGLDHEDLNYSKIYFHPTKEEASNSTLTLAETFNLKMKPDLLTISSCESGVGKVLQGEGMFSFSLGFSYLGIPSIVCSMWKVNDLYTSELMVQMYRSYLKGNSIATALRDSKLKLLREQIDIQPKDWASFILMEN